jgi:hypothetical protein
LIAESSPTPNVVTRAYNIILRKYYNILHMRRSTYANASNASISISGIGCIEFIAIITPLYTIEIYLEKKGINE